jgi:hypothetical protein
MIITNLETVLLNVPAAMPRHDPKLAHAYMRSLQEAVKSEELFVVAREGFGIRSKILGCEELTQSAALILSGSFVSATLPNINIFAIIVQRRNLAYLRGFDVDLVAVAEEPDVYESALMVDSWETWATVSKARC